MLSGVVALIAPETHLQPKFNTPHHFPAHVSFKMDSPDLERAHLKAQDQASSDPSL